MTATGTESQISFGAHRDQLRIKQVDFGKVLRNAYGALTRLPIKLLILLLEQYQTASNSVLVNFNLQKFKPQVPEILAYPSMSSGALLETFSKIPKIVATDTMWSTYKLSHLF